MENTLTAENRAALLDRWKTIQRRYAELAQKLSSIAKVAIDKNTGVNALEKALATLPPADIVAASLVELRTEVEAVLRDSKKSRREHFGLHESEFLEAAKSRSYDVREVGDGWRIGPLEFEIKKERSECRTRFNREALTIWTPVASAKDLLFLLDRSLQVLKRAEIDRKVFSDVLAHAFEAVLVEKKKSNHDRVAIHDLHKEVRMQLIKHELRTAKPEKKLAHADFSKVAFLYNLDLYRRDCSGSPSSLTFETGSQKEQSSGLGYVLNGLDARDDHRVFCYVRRTK